jgi:hypothetical protein
MVAGEHDVRPTCLSDHEHIRTIQNHVLHFLGCIEICERATFFDVHSELYEFEVQHVYERLLKSKGKQEYRQLAGGKEIDAEIRKEAEDNVKEKLKQWEKACTTEVRRIQYLRALLADDEVKETRQLVRDLVASGVKWKTSQEYKENLPKVTQWRKQQSKSTSAEGLQPAPSGIHTESSSSGEISMMAGMSPGIGSNGRLSFEPPEKYEPEKDFNLHIIEYEEAGTGEGDETNPVRLKRRLSDRKVKVDVILGKSKTIQKPEDNPLYKSKGTGTLRYIHLPANNMIVSVLGFLLAFESLQV